MFKQPWQEFALASKYALVSLWLKSCKQPGTERKIWNKTNIKNSLWPDLSISVSNNSILRTHKRSILHQNDLQKAQINVCTSKWSQPRDLRNHASGMDFPPTVHTCLIRFVIRPHKPSMHKRSIFPSREGSRFRATPYYSCHPCTHTHHARHEKGCLITCSWTDLLVPFGLQILHLSSTWHSWEQKPTGHKSAVSDWQQTVWQPCWCVLWTACWHQRARCSLCGGMHSVVQSPTMHLDTCLSAWQGGETLRSSDRDVQGNRIVLMGVRVAYSPDIGRFPYFLGFYWRRVNALFWHVKR